MILFSVPTNAVIKLADIHKIYRTGEVDVHAVRGVSLDILPGEFVAIMGEKFLTPDLIERPMKPTI